MKSIFALVIFLVQFCWYNGAIAKHIVGGEFYYKKLGSNYYQITLKIFFDCNTDNPYAIDLDKDVFIGVFDASDNSFSESFRMERGGPTRLTKKQYSCVRDPGFCTDQYTYVKNIYLDPGKKGKILSFQRCCRNATITNINDVQSTGITLWVKIPGTDAVADDNSPVFKELPPNYLCIGAPLVFDHSALDPDGDSLVYELYQPFEGATSNKARPDNTVDNGFLINPPFYNISWRFPYTTNNQIGGQPSMKIDSKTGELTVIPNVIGVFASGIKVKQYRNGVFIGETFRDYQFNIEDCEFDLISVFYAPVFSCENTVKFDNKSYKALKYRWDFGDLSSKADTSLLTNPKWTYPGNGDYRVTLKASNQICEDEYSTIVRVRSKINVDLGPDLFNCTPTDRTVTTKLYDATKTVWSTGQSGPFITIKDPGTYWARVYYDTCSAADTMTLVNKPVLFKGPADTVVCDSVKLTLYVEPKENFDLQYRWNNSLKDTFATYKISKPGVFLLSVNNGPCVVMDTINIWISGKPKIGPYFFVCNDFNKTLDAGEFIPAATYEWNDGSTGRYLDINKEGIYWVKVRQDACTNIDYLRIENPVIPLDLGPDRHFCDSFTLILNAPLNMKSYYWNDLSNLQSLMADSEGKYWVEVFDSNGCQKADTVEIAVTESPNVDVGNDTAICYRSIVHLGTSTEYFSYLWNTGSTKRNITIQDAGEFILVVTDSFGCKGSDTVRVLIDVNAMANELFIPNAFSPNDDALNEYFPFSERVTQPEFSVKIFNRWGEKIFDSKWSEIDHWDGIYPDGKNHPEAFGYLVEYRGCDGNYRWKYGTVNVLR
jgi:gliding motility-associated-like protein